MTKVENFLQEYRSEVNIAVTSFYAWKSINNLAVKDNKVLKALNTNSLLWNILTHSLHRQHGEGMLAVQIE